LLASATRTADFVDHYRTAESEYDYQWEERWIRDAGYLRIVPPVIARCLAQAGLQPADVDYFCMPGTLPKVANAVAKAVGIADTAVQDNLHTVCGETGAAHPLVMLVAAIEKAKPGDRILVAGFGQGVDALLFEVTDRIADQPARLGVTGNLARRREETNYAKFLVFNDTMEIECGMRAEVDKQTPLSVMWRNRDTVTSLIGGSCKVCGTLQFPKSISVKSHDNGARNPKAHLRNRITIDTVLNAPMVAEPLGLYDCCGVSDGAACAIVTTPDIAKGLGKRDLIAVKALQLAVSNGLEAQHNSWDGSFLATTRVAAKRAYHEAGIDKPRDEISLIEVHDCFSVTELVTMEDLYISPEGGAIRDVLDGFYDADGTVPCQIDGGLKCFGRPIGASGLRMIYEMYLQLQGRAGERQRKETPQIGLTHNVGGFPHQNVCSISIIGRHGS
jgi:hypothetical protein